MPVSVKVDTRDLEKQFKAISKRFPTVNARAINETARWARSNSEKNTAKQIRLPLKFVRKRFNVSGEAKADRSKIRRANRSRQTATLDVYMRGIPVGQIAGKPTKNQRKRPGVKAKGGRQYKGAFYTGTAAPHGHVLKRRNGGQLMMPKVGVRRRLNAQYEEHISGRRGTIEFRRRWERLANLELSKRR